MLAVANYSFFVDFYLAFVRPCTFLHCCVKRVIPEPHTFPIRTTHTQHTFPGLNGQTASAALRPRTLFEERVQCSNESTKQRRRENKNTHTQRNEADENALTSTEFFFRQSRFDVEGGNVNQT